MLERRIQIPTSPAGVTVGPFDRKAVEAAIEFLINLLDAQDGDPDTEANGDEEDGDFAEDEAAALFARMISAGPGCNIADGDSAIDDGPCDGADSGDDEEDFHEAPAPVYGLDQTTMLPQPYGVYREPVTDFPCADVIGGQPPTLRVAIR